MNVNFEFHDAAAPEKIYFEQIFAEKAGGIRVTNPNVDVPPCTGVYVDSDSRIAYLKTAKVLEATSSSTSLKIAKGHGFIVGDTIAQGADYSVLTIADADTSVEISAINTSNADYDLVTLGGAASFAKGVVFDYGFVSSEDGSGTLLGVTKDWLYANKGDQLVGLVTGANIRKETANVDEALCKTLPTLHLV